MLNDYTFSAPPQANPANRRLLPNVVDEVAAVEPDACWGEIPVSATSYDAGFRPITWRALANAINGLAGLLESKLGRSQNFETLTYMGPSDPRYVMMVLAGTKAGYKMFLDSPRNSIAAHKSLFEKLECRTIITTSPPPPFLVPIQKAFPEMKVLQIPGMDELLSTEYPHFAYNRTYEEAKHDPFLCLHTSGSTGVPKPIIYPHKFVTTTMNTSQLPPPQGFESLNDALAGNRCILFLPLFHIAGEYFANFMSIMNRTTVVFPLGNAPPTGASLGAMLKKTSVDWAFLAPMHAEEIAKDPKLLELVASNLKLILYSGGNVTDETGSALASRLRLASYLGSSEFAGFPHILPKGPGGDEDWAYVHLHPYILPKFQDRGEGHGELVIQRDDAHREWQTPFVLFSDLDEYPTKDIFKAHPTRPNTWAHQGRDDDIIVFLNGEKTNPVSFEATVGKHPDVRSALVFGNKRYEAGVLIELGPETAVPTTPEDKAKLTADIYRIIEEANAVTPAHARISKSHIIFATPDKPFLRAAKGTVQRQVTTKLYEDAINDLYKSIDAIPSKSEAGPRLANGAAHLNGVNGVTNGHTNGAVPNGVTSDTPLEKAVFAAVQDATTLSITDPDDDFFASGLDSLQALRLSRSLRTELMRSDIEPGLIYPNPSVRALAAALDQSSGTNHHATVTTASASAAEALFAKHAAYMEILSSCINASSADALVPHGSSGDVVLLTGFTGFIGAYVLDALLADPSVSHVYCLNRRDVPAPSSSRVTHLMSDLNDPVHLGLAPSSYAALISSVTLVIHAAWPVDFAQPLPRFGQSLAGTTHLLLLAARAPRKPGFLFVSSVAAMMNFKHDDVPVPSSVTDSMAAPTLGYGESKHLAEMLVSDAARNYGIKAGIARLGQIAGPRTTNGEWNAKEWFPRLIRSSKELGCVPKSLGGMADVLDWVPVDEVAQVLTELGLAIVSRREKPESKAWAEVFNVVNPRPGSWQEAISGAREALGGVDVVDGSEWLTRLTRIGEAVEDGKNATAYEEMVKKHPALPLEGFYRGLFADKYPLRMDTQSAEGVSKTMQTLRTVDSGMVEAWVRAMVKV